MSRLRFLFRLFTLIVVVLTSACATSPTGSKQLKLFPESQMAQMGAASYTQMKEQTSLSKSKVTNRYVSCAITRETGTSYQWEVNVFNDKAVNAFALPSGKMGVYTGLLQVSVNQHQLVAVLGHEVAHVIANHSNERVLVVFATNSGMKMTQVLAGKQTPMNSQLLGLLGLGAQIGVMLPYGRTQES